MKLPLLRELCLNRSRSSEATDRLLSARKFLAVSLRNGHVCTFQRPKWPGGRYSSGGRKVRGHSRHPCRVPDGVAPTQSGTASTGCPFARQHHFATTACPRGATCAATGSTRKRCAAVESCAPQTGPAQRHRDDDRAQCDHGGTIDARRCVGVFAFASGRRRSVRRGRGEAGATCCGPDAVARRPTQVRRCISQ